MHSDDDHDDGSSGDDIEEYFEQTDSNNKKISRHDNSMDSRDNLVGRNNNTSSTISYIPPSKTINFDDVSDDNLSKLPLNFDINNFVNAAECFIRDFKKTLTVRDPKTKKFVKKTVHLYNDIVRLFSQKTIKLMDIDYQHYVDWVFKYFEKMMEICQKHSFVYPVVDIEKLDPYEKNDLFVYMHCKKLLEYVDKDRVEDFQKVMKYAALKRYKDEFDNDLELELNEDTKDPETTKAFLATHVGIKNFPNERDIYQIKPEFLNKAIVVKGDLVTFDDKSRVEIIKSCWRCSGCNHITAIGGSNKPTRCVGCGERSYFEDTNKYENTSYIYIKIQQQTNSSDLQIGSTNLTVKIEGSYLIENFYKKMKQGATLKITGIVKLSQERLNRNNLNERLLQLHAITVEIEGENTTVQYSDKLLDVTSKLNPAYIDQHFAKLHRSICPHLYGREPLKMTVLLMCVGAVPRIDRVSKHRSRGDINALFCGDPGTGKTELGKFIENLLPFSIRTVGGKATTTKAALTTSSEEINGIRVVTKGVLPMCSDRGIAIVDELDKRDSDDMQILSIPMDDNQVIPTHKSGYHHNVPARCPVLLIGNATKNHGKWNKSKTIGEQTNYAVWLVSRVDLVFVVTDDNDLQEKERMVDHIAKSRSNMVAEQDYVKNYKNKTYSDASIEKIENDFANNRFDGVYDTEYLRHEIHYLKQNYKPTIRPGSDVEALLKKEYLRFSQLTILNDDGGGDGPYSQAIMDARAYNGLERISMAIARCRRHHFVTLDDMDKALDLMMSSITSMMPQPKSENEKLVDPNQSIYKQMKKLYNSPEGASKIHAAETAGWINKRDQYIKEYRKKLYRFNQILFRRGFYNCVDCHGNGYVSAETAAGTQTETCVQCKGIKVFTRKFTFLDFQTDVINAKLMTDFEINNWFHEYRKSGIVKAMGGNTYEMGLNTIDSIEMSDFVDSLSIRLANEKIQKERDIYERGGS